MEETSIQHPVFVPFCAVTKSRHTEGSAPTCGGLAAVADHQLTEGNFCPSEVLLLVQEPHAWVARARLSGFPGASLDLPSARGLASLEIVLRHETCGVS